MRPDVNDNVNAAAEYVWFSVMFNDECLPLDVAIPEELRSDVEALLRRYVEGERLSGHRSAEVFEDLREKFAALWMSKSKTL